ncbi:rhodanese-like domain-containing protein [Candidatus Bipolaricaulota bacterium]|nr:rhodanese-like domain-containing protein [Candidatus Bipolaricaulota bacterium]
MQSQLKGAGLLALTVLMSLALSGCWATQPGSEADDSTFQLPPYGVITTQQAASVIVALQDDAEFVLLDIRTPAEVEAGHISGATTLDYYSSSFRDDLAKLDRELTILIYCRTGNRTGQAYQIMQELGFEKVFDMGGGISQWLAANYPLCLGALDAEHHCTGEFPIL